MTDDALLREFVAHRSEAAFTELVNRHAAGGYHCEALVQTIPPLGRARVEDGKYRVDLNLPAGRRYRLDASVDLIHWTPTATNTVVPGAMTLEPASGSSGSGTGFFRATLVP